MYLLICLTFLCVSFVNSGCWVRESKIFSNVLHTVSKSANSLRRSETLDRRTLSTKYCHPTCFSFVISSSVLPCARSSSSSNARSSATGRRRQRSEEHTSELQSL